MTGTPTVAQEDLNRLRAFQRQTDWLRNSKLLAENKVSFKFNSKYSFTTGETKFTFEGYDETAFLAALPVLRQFILEREPVSLFGVHNIIMRICDREDLKAWVRHARSQWKETLSGMPSDRLMFFHTSGTIENAIEHLFYGYGGLFHVNLEHPESDEQTRILLNAALQKAFPKLWNSIHNIDSVIHFWLDAPSKAVPACP